MYSPVLPVSPFMFPSEASINTVMVSSESLWLRHGNTMNDLTSFSLLTSFSSAALLLWFFGDFRCGALLFVVIHVIYKYENR